MSKNYVPYLPPSKEETNDRQLGPILAVLRSLEPFVLEPVLEPGSTPKDNSMDGGVKSSAASTFIRACARIDSILDDNARWSLRDRNSLMAELVRTQKAQQAFIETQIASSENLQAPHFLLRPTLALAAGGYVAFWGNITVAGEAIIGKGPTPNAALEDFDAAFERTPEEQIYLVAEKAGVKIDKPTDKP